LQKSERCVVKTHSDSGHSGFVLTWSMSLERRASSESLVFGHEMVHLFTKYQAWVFHVWQCLTIPLVAWEWTQKSHFLCWATGLGVLFKPMSNADYTIARSFGLAHCVIPGAGLAAWLAWRQIWTSPCGRQDWDLGLNWGKGYELQTLGKLVKVLVIRAT
jgi:hypothetical protein